MLLDFGANSDVQHESENHTSISIAAGNSDLEMVEFLLARGMMRDMDDSTLLCALQELDRSDTLDSEGYQVVQTLVKHGVEVYMDACLNDQPLVVAARYGLKDIVALFLQAVFLSAEIRQEHIENAVCVAAEEDEADILKELIAHYIHRDTDEKRLSPWDWAKDHSYAHPAELLRPYYRRITGTGDGLDPRSEPSIDDSNAT